MKSGSLKHHVRLLATISQNAATSCRAHVYQLGQTSDYIKYLDPDNQISQQRFLTMSWAIDSKTSNHPTLYSIDWVSKESFDVSPKHQSIIARAFILAAAKLCALSLQHDALFPLLIGTSSASLIASKPRCFRFLRVGPTCTRYLARGVLASLAPHSQATQALPSLCTNWYTLVHSLWLVTFSPTFTRILQTRVVCTSW